MERYLIWLKQDFCKEGKEFLDQLGSTCELVESKGFHRLFEHSQGCPISILLCRVHSNWEQSLWSLKESREWRHICTSCLTSEGLSYVDRRCRVLKSGSFTNKVRFEPNPQENEYCSAKISKIAQVNLRWRTTLTLSLVTRSTKTQFCYIECWRILIQQGLN